MKKEEILKKMDKLLKNWDNVVKEHEGDIRESIRKEELRELKALEVASNMWLD